MRRQRAAAGPALGRSSLAQVRVELLSLGLAAGDRGLEVLQAELQLLVRQQALGAGAALAREPDRLRGYLAEDAAAPLRDDLVGHALRAMLLGKHPARPDDEPALEAALEAAGWLAGVGSDLLPPRPDPRDLRRQLSRVRLQRRLDATARHFVGREDALKRLARFADEAPDPSGSIPVLSVAGIGGIGKSALLARFLRDRIAPTAPDDPRPVPFHLDFDRFGATTASQAEWTFELCRQLAFYLPALAAQLDEKLEKAQKFYAQSVEAGAGEPHTSSEEQSVALESVIFASDDVTYTLFAALNDEPSLRSRTLLLIFDTVEALQTRSVDGLLRLARWIEGSCRMVGFAGIRVVLSGRVAAALPGSLFAARRPLELDELAPAHARVLLGHLGIGPEQAAAAVGEFGGNPLVLRLVAQLALGAGVDLAALARDPEVRGAADRELTQGVLYRRILDHISAGDIAELAHPGLAVRRVDSQLIQHVLAPVCLGRQVSPEEASTLYKALAREVWLVEPAPDGADAVVHRSDLRRLTMRVIARDPEEAWRTVDVHRATVAYYEQGPGHADPWAVSEALYHRFMVPGRVMLPPLDDEIARCAREAIGTNIDELPRENLAALRAALREGVRSDDAFDLSDDLWEAFLHKRGEELAERDAFAAALDLVASRPVPGGRLAGDWHVAALDAEARWGELFDRLSPPGDEWRSDHRFARLRAWLAAGQKAGRLPPPERAPTEVRDTLGVLGEGSATDALAVHAYLLRCGWPEPSWSLAPQSLTTSDLISDGALAVQLVNYLQARPTGAPPVRFRPVRAQFFPSQVWLRDLIAIAGDLAAERLVALFSTLEKAVGEGLPSGRLLGRFSDEFQSAWTDAFARDAITPEATERLLAVREFPEFRAPARVALLRGFRTPAALEELIARLRPTLPLIPSDFAPDSLSRLSGNPRDLVANLVAFADRCQLLHHLLRLAAELRPRDRRLRVVLQGLERWFTPEEKQRARPVPPSAPSSVTAIAYSN